jgi:hypothetical protein
MRRIFVAALLCLVGAPAAADPPNAQAAFVERTGLLHIDTRCHVLSAGPRTALEAGAAQARGALLRAGWTMARLSELEAAVLQAARERACTDPRVATSVAEARASFEYWAETGSMEFPGWQRAWVARRTTGPNGFRLSQRIDAPTRATFGVREREGGQRLSLVTDQGAPTAARLILRDAARSRAGALDLSTRVAYGLQAGAPGVGAVTRSFAGVRATERRTGSGGQQVVFAFPDEAFRALLALDPRESATLELSSGAVTQRLYIEVGDIAAARTFLALRPEQP